MPPAPTSQHHALVALLGAVALWSGSLSVVRVAVEDTSPGAVTFLRSLIGALVLALVVIIRRRRRAPTERVRTERRPGRRWAAASGAATGAAFLLVAIGMQHVGSGPAGIVLSSIPGLTVLMSVAFATPAAGTGRHQLPALGVGLLAALAVMSDTGGSWTIAGMLALACAAVAQAAANVFADRSLRSRDPGLVAAITLAVAAAVTMPFAHISHMPSARAVIAIVVLGVLPSGLAYVLYCQGIVALGCERAASANFLVPPLAIAFGVVVLGELPGLGTLLGLILAMLALALSLGVADVRRRGRIERQPSLS